MDGDIIGREDDIDRECFVDDVALDIHMFSPSMNFKAFDKTQGSNDNQVYEKNALVY